MLIFYKHLIPQVLRKQLDLLVIFVLLTQVVSILSYLLLLVLHLQERLKEFKLLNQELNML